MAFSWRLCGLMMMGLGLISCGRSASEGLTTRVDQQSKRTSGDVLTANATAVAQASELDAIVGTNCAEASGGGYERRTLTVAGLSYGESAGLYLHAGERARITAEGSWTIWQDVTAAFGPAGHPQLSLFQGCRKGALVATIGLGLTAPRFCVGAGAEVAAPVDGLVYLSMNDSGAPTFHGGAITVTVESTGDPVPAVAAADATTFAYCDSPSGWVELHGDKPIILTVPAALAEQNRETTSPSLARLGEIYVAAQELSGVVPFAGEPIRLMPDFSVRPGSWIVAGNPILYDPRLLNGVAPSHTRILGLAAPDAELFELARAIGVTFSRAHGSRFQPDDRAAAAWGGLFAYYAGQRVPLGPITKSPCQGRDTQVQRGTTATWLSSADLQLCLLTDLTTRFGWDVHKRFFAGLPQGEAWNTVLAAASDVPTTWAWVRSQYVALAGADADQIFATFHAP